MFLALLVVKVPGINFELLDSGSDAVEASQREPMCLFFIDILYRCITSCILCMYVCMYVITWKFCDERRR